MIMCGYVSVECVQSWKVEVIYNCFFFFSSRRRHTRFDCDWSSDVCSSDLITWTTAGTVADVKLEYSTDNFVTPILITGSTPAAGGSFAWTVPDAISTTVKIGRASCRERV